MYVTAENYNIILFITAVNQLEVKTNKFFQIHLYTIEKVKRIKFITEIYN